MRPLRGAGAAAGVTALYNEIDGAACAVLRRMIDDDVIASGVVESRSIVDLSPADVAGRAQCHFFAGGGLWSVAARLAGWPDARPLWTASCPRQPFSQAGKGGGRDDPRHLWPDLFRLVRACRPAVLVGEQVASTAGLDWFDGVAADLAGAGYACRAVDLPAAAVDAPHIRQRLYWVAVADADGGGCSGRPQDAQRRALGRDAAERAAGALGDADARGQLQQQGAVADERGRRRDSDARRNGSFWSDAEWIACRDGKTRRAKPGIRLLVDGIPGRVGLWRLAGNAIVPQLAAEVLAALMDVLPEGVA